MGQPLIVSTISKFPEQHILLAILETKFAPILVWKSNLGWLFQFVLIPVSKSDVRQNSESDRLLSITQSHFSPLWEKRKTELVFFENKLKYWSFFIWNVRSNVTFSFPGWNKGSLQTHWQTLRFCGILNAAASNEGWIQIQYPSSICRRVCR